MKEPKYHMVKKKLQIIEREELEGILRGEKYLNLALCKENEPYIVTLSYGYDPKKQAIYFHCARRGLKLNFLKANPLVCGTVIRDLGYAYSKCTHKFKSVVFRGTAVQVISLEEMKHAYHIMIYQLEKEPKLVSERLIKNEFQLKRALLFRIDIEELCGKGNV